MDSLFPLISYFLRLGALGFGGPIALVGAMHRDLVETRGWLSEEEYREGLALAQLAPGPLAAQLAIYIGYVRGSILGAGLVGVAFILPSFLIVVALGAAYVRYGGLPWMQAVFYGVGAAVIGLIARSAYGLTKKTVGGDVLLWIIYLVLAIATVLTGREIVWLFPLAGIAAWLWRAPPAFLRRRGVLPDGGALLLQLLGFFAFAGTFVFGSGLAIVPFLHGGVVLDHQWLTERQFLDAVAVALITPGPVVITTAFIGFLVAGFAGAVVAAVGTFAPCFLFTVIPAPYFRRYGSRPWLAAVVAGVTAAATGAIAGAVVVLGQRSIIDLPTALIAIMALLATTFRRKIPEPLVILAAALAGLALKSGG
ncbi:MAG: chromate efflux transporter [Gemmatimonadota bacterium]